MMQEIAIVALIIVILCIVLETFATAGGIQQMLLHLGKGLTILIIATISIAGGGSILLLLIELFK